MAIAVVILEAYLGFTLLGAAYGKARAVVRRREKRAAATWSLVVAEMLAGSALLAGVLIGATALAVGVFLAVGVATKAFRRWRNASANCACLGEPRRIDAAELTAGCVQIAAAAVVLALADGGPALGSARAIGGATAAVAYLVIAAGVAAVRPRAT